MFVQHFVLLHTKELKAVSRCNFVQELGEVASVALLMVGKVGCDEDDALVGESATSSATFPETDVDEHSLLVDEHIESYSMLLESDGFHTDAVVLIEVNGDVKL